MWVLIGKKVCLLLSHPYCSHHIHNGRVFPRLNLCHRLRRSRKRGPVVVRQRGRVAVVVLKAGLGDLSQGGHGAVDEGRASVQVPLSGDGDGGDLGQRHAVAVEDLAVRPERLLNRELRAAPPLLCSDVVKLLRRSDEQRWRDLVEETSGGWGSLRVEAGED